MPLALLNRDGAISPPTNPQFHGCVLVKPFAVSSIILGILVSAPALANSACFTADEAKAAHFRTMLQEFNVAALNCQSTDPNDPNPSIRDRYNTFVAKHGSKLSQNAQAVRSHFSRAGGSLDIWMTKVANADGQAVMTDPNYCQQASDKLDKALDLPGEQLETYAASAQTFDPYVDECPSKAVAPTHTAKKKAGKAEHKKAKASEKTAQN